MNVKSPQPPFAKGGVRGDYRSILDFDIHLAFACLPVGREFDIWN